MHFWARDQLRQLGCGTLLLRGRFICSYRCFSFCLKLRRLCEVARCLATSSSLESLEGSRKRNSWPLPARRGLCPSSSLMVGRRISFRHRRLHGMLRACRCFRVSFLVWPCMQHKSRVQIVKGKCSISIQRSTHNTGPRFDNSLRELPAQSSDACYRSEWSNSLIRHYCRMCSRPHPRGRYRMKNAQKGRCAFSNSGRVLTTGSLVPRSTIQLPLAPSRHAGLLARREEQAVFLADKSRIARRGLDLGLALPSCASTTPFRA